MRFSRFAKKNKRPSKWTFMKDVAASNFFGFWDLSDARNLKLLGEFRHGASTISSSVYAKIRRPTKTGAMCPLWFGVLVHPLPVGIVARPLPKLALFTAINRLGHYQRRDAEAISTPGNRFYQDVEALKDTPWNVTRTMFVFDATRYIILSIFKPTTSWLIKNNFQAYYGGEARCEEGLAFKWSAGGGESLIHLS